MRPIRKNKNSIPPNTNNVSPHTPRYRVRGGSAGSSSRPSAQKSMRNARLSQMKPVRTVNAHKPVVPVRIETDKAPGLLERFYNWRLGFSFDTESILRGIVIGALLVFFAVLQTTFLSRFRPFGKTPDLMLPFVMTVGVLEREKCGAVCALISAFVIEAVTGASLTLLPLLYVPVAVAAALLTFNRLIDSVPVMVIYTISASLLRSVVSFIIVMCTVKGIGVSAAVFSNVIPEFSSTVLISAIPQIITRLALKPFHKTRAERTGVTE